VMSFLAQRASGNVLHRHAFDRTCACDRS
jgi:hypothetical protein